MTDLPQAETARKAPTEFECWQDVYDLIILLCEHDAKFHKRGAATLRFLNRLERGPVPRPFCDWHEDMGDVLWWFIPISESPYLGSPLDLGYTVGTQVIIGSRSSEIAKIGDMLGWPFTECDIPRLWWTPLPDAKSIEDQVPL